MQGGKQHKVKTIKPQNQYISIIIQYSIKITSATLKLHQSQTISSTDGCYGHLVILNVWICVPRQTKRITFCKASLGLSRLMKDRFICSHVSRWLNETSTFRGSVPLSISCYGLKVGAGMLPSYPACEFPSSILLVAVGNRVHYFIWHFIFVLVSN